MIISCNAVKIEVQRILSRAHRIFDFTVLYFFLAIDATRSPRQRVQPFFPDRRATLQAFSVAALAYPFQSKADERQLRMPICPLGEKQLFLIRRHSLVGDILNFVGYSLAALFHGGQHRPLQLSLLLEQLFFKPPYVLGRLGHFT